MDDQRIEAIEARNKKVEMDKAWETSWTRRISIAMLTYLTVAGYLLVIKNPRPFINAIVPVVGYILSTLVLPNIRSMWQRNKQH